MTAGPVRRRTIARRHPTEVTSDRLAEHLDRSFDSTDSATRDAIGKVRDWLDRLAAGAER